jgi:putative phosphoesterase
VCQHRDRDLHQEAERLNRVNAMRVAALYDIHGNLPALEAVLVDVRRAAVDLIVVGGDVFPGPMCREALACLGETDVPVHFLRGNGDRDTLALAMGDAVVGVPEQYLPAMRWVAGQLDESDRRTIAGWPASLSIDVGGLGRVLFCHATPQSDTAIFTRLTPQERLRPLFEPTGADVVVCGHTHMPFDRQIGPVRVINAGSVGMPFGEPGAYWLLLGPDVNLRRTDFDVTAAAARIRASAYPEADEFAASSVLHPPAEQQMLERFRAAELR